MNQPVRGGPAPHENNFNALRLTAASLVLVSHGIELPSGGASRDIAFALTGRTFSWYAVSAFFVISGYLVLQSWDRRPSLVAFAWARFLRIMPGLAVMLLVSVAVLGWVFSRLALPEFLTHRQTIAYVLGCLSIVGVKYELPGVFENNPLRAVNGSLWTLRYEVACYAVLAVLGAVGMLGRRPIRRAALIGMGAAAAAVAVAIDWQTAHPSGRLALLYEAGRLGFCFALGAFYTELADRLPLRLPLVAGLLLASAAAVGTPAFTPVASVALAYAVFWFAFVPDGRALRHLRHGADYSYGVYIYGFPVQQAIVAVAPGLAPAGVIVLGFLLTLPYAILSWHLVEEPALALKRRFGAKRRTPPAAPGQGQAPATAAGPVVAGVRGRVLRVLGSDRHFRAAFSATSIALVLKVAGAVASFVVGLIIARRFGPAGSGIYGLAITAMTIAGLVSLVGLDYSSVRAVAAYRATGDGARLKAWIRTALALTVGVGAVASLALWFGADRLARGLNGGAALAQTLVVMGLAVVPFALGRLLSGFLRGANRFVPGYVVDPFLISAGMALVMLALPLRSVVDVAVAYTGVSVVVVLTGMVLCRGIAGARSAPSGWVLGEALRKSLPVYGTVLGAFATQWITILGVGAWGSEADAGIYRVAWQFAGLQSFVLQAVESAMSPQFAALKARDELGDIAPAARRVTALLLVAAGIPALVFFVFARELLALFGPGFAAGTECLRILVISQFALAVLGPVGSILTMTDLERFSFWNSLAGAMLAALLSVALIPGYGVNGAAAAAGLTLIARALIATAIVWRNHGLFFPLGLTRTKVRPAE